MKYYFLLKICIKGYDYYIHVLKEYDLKVHPNLTDTICVEDYECTIEEIVHFINDSYKDDYKIWIKLKSYSPLYKFDTEERAIKYLEEELHELKEYGWILNDYDFGDCIIKRSEKS